MPHHHSGSPMVHKPLSLRLKTAPTEQAITNVDAARHLLGVETDDADRLNAVLASANRLAETQTNRQFITATYVWNLDDFPRPD